LLLALPSLALGFFADDYLFIASLERRLSFNAPWWDLYRFTPAGSGELRRLITEGRFPWWTATDLRVHLVRPLSSALLAFDRELFGHYALGWHLHSLLWYLALLVAAGAFFRSVLPTRSATLALLLFVLSDANVFPFSWLSARYGLQAATFVTVGLTAHVRARRNGWRVGLWLARGALGVGLLAGESALGGVAFVLAYDLLAAPTDRMLDRILKALPNVGLVLAYLAVYGLAGGGARGSGGYVSPIAEPFAFAAAAVIRVPLLLGDAIAGVPPELANTGTYAALPTLGAIATFLFVLHLRACAPFVPQDEKGALRWLLAGALAAMIPGVGGFPGARELLIPNLGFAPVLAAALHGAGPPGQLEKVRRVGAGLLAIVHLGFAPLTQLLTQYSTLKMARASEDIAHDVAREAHGDDRIFVVTASDPMTTTYPPLIVAVESDAAPKCWAQLSGARSDVTVTRTGPASFTVAPREQPFLRAPFETLYRSPSRPLRSGDDALVCGARVRVVESQQGRATKIEVTSDRALETPGTAWFVWQTGAMHRISFPPIHQSLTVGWSPGPSRLY
jgi:hypothetical protein